MNEERVPLARPRVGDAEAEAVRRVLESRHLAQGPEAAALESEVAALLGGGVEVVAVASGGAALLAALRALGVAPGDEVVVPAYTFPAAAHAAVWLGAKPVPADVDESTLAPGPAEVAARLSDRTRAVVVAHAFGIPAEVEAVAELCRDRGVALVEDSACSLGGLTPSGRPSGTVGDVACFSLHPRKLATSGEGGLLAAPPALAARLRTMRDYGRTGKGFFDVFGAVGLNLRLSDLAAAVARVQVAALPESLAARARIAEGYLVALAAVPGVRVPPGTARPGATIQTLLVRVDDAPAVAARLDALGVGAGPGAHALTQQAFYRERFGDGPACPVAESLARTALALPLYEEMTDSEVGRVVSAVREAVAGG
jgi:dTDP-4-amino-4,6-dideoxygalactose transaminase